MNYSTFRNKSVATNKANLLQAIQLVLQNLEENKKSYKVYNILRIGRVLEGEAYYHEIDQYYKCVGVEVEIESQKEFESEGKNHLGDLATEVGFYSLWVGKSPNAAPVTFKEGYGDFGSCHKFTNGCGDDITVLKTIFTAEEVQSVADKVRNK